MKLLIAPLALVCCLALASPAPVAGASVQPELRAMTFNLRYGSDTGPHAWPLRLPVCVEQIRVEQPAVIGTQEGLWRQVRDLEAALPEFAWVGLGREGGSHGEFMAIFYERERFELLEFDHFWLSDTPDRIGSTSWGNSNRRMVTWARLGERAGGAQFVVYNTHFDHQVAVARRKSAELVLAHVREHFPELPVLLLGDFNALEDSPPHAHLVREDAFRDAWLEAAERGPAISTFHGYRGPQEGQRRIDWVLVRGGWEVRRAWVATHERGGRYPSDHFPVLADLRLEAD